MNKRKTGLAGLGAVLLLCGGMQRPRLADVAGGERRTWTVDGVEREAVVFAPASAKERPTPIVFGFHGHGGNTRNSSRSWAVHKAWPDAIVVYMQGLPTKGMTDPDGKKNGWQQAPGDNGNRDVKFFDAAMASMEKDYKVDEKRVYSMGHSNGAVFSYVLMAERGDKVKAIGVVAGVAARAGPNLKPMPVIHFAGTGDPIVPFTWQQQTFDRVKKVNGCEEKGTKWAEKGLIYASKSGTPLVTWVHEGGHEYPKDATELIVKFFKEVGEKAK